jgi:glycosyltransferase involved in cell wall biosynthesis
VIVRLDRNRFVLLHIAPVVWDKISGLSVSIPELARMQNRFEDVAAGLVTTRQNNQIPRGLEVAVFDHNRILNKAGPRVFNLPEPFDFPDLVVFHSAYVPRQARIAASLRKAEVPYLICPRGSLTKGARNRKRLKKWLGDALFLRKMVRGAVAVHYLSQTEAGQSVGWNENSIVVENGTHLPASSDLASPGQKEPRTLLFLGRLEVQQKGLDLLLEACHRIRFGLLSASPRVLVHGPAGEITAGALAARASSLGLREIITIGGPLQGSAKAAVFRETDVFLHTSRFEGHPMVVLEALSYGIPCLLTPATGMAEKVAAAGAGWMVQPNPSDIASALEKLLQLPAARLKEAGHNAHELVRRNYTWEAVARRSVERYRECMTEFVDSKST